MAQNGMVSKQSQTLWRSHTLRAYSKPEEVQLYSQPSNLEILEARATREGERAICWESQL